MSLDSGGFSSKNKKGVQPFKTDLVENKLEHRRKHTSLIKGKNANQSPTGLSRPVGNAIKNVSPNDSVYQNTEKINSFDKKTELPQRNLLQVKPLLILCVLLGLIILYLKTAKKSMFLMKKVAIHKPN